MEYPNIDMIATGKRIQELRKAENKSVREIADFMGFEATQAIYKWEQGKGLFTIDNFFALCKFLNIEKISDLLIERKDDAPEPERDEDRDR